MCFCWWNVPNFQGDLFSSTKLHVVWGFHSFLHRVRVKPGSRTCRITRGLPVALEEPVGERKQEGPLLQPTAHLGSLQDEHVVIGVIMKSMGSRDPQTEPGGLGGGGL